jgi:hypothetical protein
MKVEKKPEPIVVVNLPEITEVFKSEKLKVIRNKREVYYDDLPKKLQLCWDQNRDDYKEIRALHEKLKLMEKSTDDDRSKLTMRIVGLDEDIRKRWEEIDTWNPVPEDMKIDHKRIGSNRKAISIWLDKLDKGCPDQEMVIAHLQERYDELWANHVDISSKTLNQLIKWGVRINGITDGDTTG